MEHRHRAAEQSKVPLQLHRAADVAGGDRGGAGGDHRARLALAEAGGDLGLLEVVRPRRAAANAGVLELDQPHARRSRAAGGAARRRCRAPAADGRRPDRPPRPLDRATAAPPDPADRGTRARRPCVERARSRPFPRAVPAKRSGYSAIPEPQPAAVVTIASTSRGKASRLRRASERADVEQSVVHRERAAAALAGRDHHLDAVARQHAQRRRGDLGPQHLLRAAGEERHPGAARALGGDAAAAATPAAAAGAALRRPSRAAIASSAAGAAPRTAPSARLAAPGETAPDSAARSG